METETASAAEHLAWDFAVFIHSDLEFTSFEITNFAML